ncbi:MAG: glycosyltransferase [Myxococcota bacterium]
MPRVELVVPCYNEAHRLDGEAFVRFRSDRFDASFLFVDDGSGDATATTLARLCSRAPERLSWMRLDRNRGKAEAVREGMRRALGQGRADYVGYWDADLATPLEELPRFVAALEQDPDVELVMGARVQLLGHRIDRKFHRHAYGRVFTTAVAVLLDLPLYDTQCGAKLFRATDDVRAAFVDPFVTRWIFDVEILARLMGRWERRGIDTTTRLRELPLERWHDVPGSKVTTRDAVLALRDLARLARAYRVPIAARRARR